jgi:hypothetical protein
MGVSAGVLGAIPILVMSTGRQGVFYSVWHRNLTRMRMSKEKAQGIQQEA